MSLVSFVAASRRPVPPPAATVHTWPLRSLNSGASFVRPFVRRPQRPPPPPPPVYLLPIKHWATITTFTAATAAARRQRRPLGGRGRQWFHVELTIGGSIANFPGTSKTNDEEEKEGGSRWRRAATCISPKTSAQSMKPIVVLKLGF